MPPMNLLAYWICYQHFKFFCSYSLCRAFEIIEPCSHLWCGHVDSPLVCKTKKGPPLEGTDCGFGKVCKQNTI